MPAGHAVQKPHDGGLVGGVLLRDSKSGMHGRGISLYEHVGFLEDFYLDRSAGAGVVEDFLLTSVLVWWGVSF